MGWVKTPWEKRTLTLTAGRVCALKLETSPKEERKMKANRNFGFILIMFTILVVNTASADWNAPKWVQMPDVTSLGMDVQADSLRHLADDFLCTETGPITDIHLWGSWLNDDLPVVDNTPDAANITFNLGIYADQPATSQIHSRPLDNPLWSIQMNPTSVRIHRDNLDEGWYDPYEEEYISSADTICWQYNFLIDTQDAFVQMGTPSNPIVYWLAIQAVPDDQEAHFGWKTSIMHWNDDAVWGYGQEPPVDTQWGELRYPQGHLYMGQSIDLAFVITPEPTTLVILGMGSVLITRMRKKIRFCN